LLGFLAIITLVIASQGSTLIVLFLLSLLLIVSVSPPRKWFLNRLSVALFSLVPFLIVMPFVSQTGEPDWSWRFLEFRVAGLVSASVLVMRTLAILFVVLALLVAGPMHQYLDAARRLGVPSLLVHLMSLTYRYTFLLTEELGRLRISLRVRGFRNGMTKHAYHTISNAAGTLIVRSANRAEMVSHAMHARGFDGVFRALPGPKWRRIDSMVVGSVVLLLGCVIAWDLWQRLS